MDINLIIISGILFLIIAFLYSSVGHAGASGYLAVMALLAYPVESIKPISLTLNIIVSLIASYKFIKAGYFDKKLFVLVSITSIPLAFVGGYLNLDPYWFKKLAGVFLIASGVLLLLRQFIKPAEKTREIHPVAALVLGALIGFTSGLLGVGGGIFLSPIIIMLGFTTLRNASGVAALFILCNSILGLTGNYMAFKNLPVEIVYLIPMVIIGGYTGSHLGSQKLNNQYIVSFLFLVLISAGLKFLIIG